MHTILHMHKASGVNCDDENNLMEKLQFFAFCCILCVCVDSVFPLWM